MGTGAPYRVVDADHWSFEGTGLADGDLFGEEWLDARNPGGASGHETDKMNEHRPPARALLAKGINPHEGGSELVTFETASGGEVFSTGSISWICSLPVATTCRTSPPTSCGASAAERRPKPTRRPMPRPP